MIIKLINLIIEGVDKLNIRNLRMKKMNKEDINVLLWVAWKHEDKEKGGKVDGIERKRHFHSYIHQFLYNTIQFNSKANNNIETH